MKRWTMMLAGAAALAAASGAQAAEKVTLQLKWVTQAQFAGYYVAQEKGFYADAGLDVPKDLIAQLTVELKPFEGRRKGALSLQDIRDGVRTRPLAVVARELAARSLERMQTPREGEPSKPDDLTFVLFRR